MNELAQCSETMAREIEFGLSLFMCSRSHSTTVVDYVTAIHLVQTANCGCQQMSYDDRSC